MTLASQVSIVHLLNAPKNAMETVSAPMELATVDRDGQVKTALFQPAQTIAIIMVNVRMANATAVLGSLVKTVQFARVLRDAMVMGRVQTSLVSAEMDGLDLIVLSNPAHRSAPGMVTATMELASVNQDSLEYTALFQLARLPVLEMVNAPRRDRPWLAFATKGMKVMIALKNHVQMTAPLTGNVSMEFVRAIMVGVARIAPGVVLVLASAALEMANVWMERVLVIQDGQAMVATTARASMTALSMASVTMVHAFAKKDTGDVTAHYLPNPSLASVPSIVCVDVSNNAQKFMRHKGPVHLTSATLSALKNVFLSVWLGKCL